MKRETVRGSTLRSLILYAGISATLLSCGEPTGPEGPNGARGPALTIGSASAVNGFAFLDPIGVRETRSGAGDTSLSPVVEICRIDGAACVLPFVATFTRSVGSGAEVVRVSETGYLVNWNTSKYPVVADTYYRIQVRVGANFLGYADVRVVNDARPANRDAGFTLIKGATLPVRFRIESGSIPPGGVSRAVPIAEAAVTKSIGTAGGSIEVTSAGVTYSLAIPAGALLETQNITLTPLAGITNLPLSGGFKAGVSFAPEGLVFHKAATLTMQFPADSDLENVHGFGYSGDGAAIYMKLDTKLGTTISVPVSHFSGAGAGGATLVDIDALVNSVSVNFPSELYPTVMKQAQLQLSQQICGGPDFVFDCGDSQAEMTAFLQAWDDTVEDVLIRWYDDRLAALLLGSTASNGALSRASDEFFGGWKASMLLVFGTTIPSALEARSDSGETLAAKGYQASLLRARADCADSTAVRQFGKIALLSLEGFDLGGGETLPTDIEDIGSRNTCTEFRTSGLPSQLARDTTDTLQLQVIRAVGSTETVLPWPMGVTYKILPSTSGLVCGIVEGGSSFTDTIDPSTLMMRVTLATDPMPNECTEIALEISTPYYAPGSDPPPGLFNKAVFGKTDTLHIPVAPPNVTVTINPAAAILQPGGTAQFTATVTGADNNAVTWSTTGGGTISASGLYSAGQTAGSYRVIAKSVEEATAADTATVTISAPAGISVVVSPATATVLVGETIQFTATVIGSSNQTVFWNASGGTITQTGLFTAGTRPGTGYGINATPAADPSKNVTVFVNVSGGPPGASLVSNNCNVSLNGYVDLETNPFDRQFIPYNESISQSVMFTPFTGNLTTPSLQVSNEFGSVTASGSVQQSSSVVAGAAAGSITSGTMSGQARSDTRDGTPDWNSGRGYIDGTTNCSVVFDVVNGPVRLTLSGNVSVTQSGESGQSSHALVELGRTGCFSGCGVTENDRRWSLMTPGSETVSSVVDLPFGRWAITFLTYSISGNCCDEQGAVRNGLSQGSVSFSFTAPP